MDHGGVEARLARSADLGMAGAVQGGEAHISTGGQQLGAAAAARCVAFDELVRRVHAAVGRGEVPVPVFISASGLQPGSAHVVLVGLPLPGGVVVPLHADHDYSALLPRSVSGAGRGVALADLLPYGGGGAGYNVDYTLQLRPGAGHGEVLLVGLLPDGAGHGEVHADLLPGGVDAVHDDYRYYYALPLQPRPGAGRGLVLAAHLPGGGGAVDAVYDNYGDYAWQPHQGAGRGGPLRDGVGAVFDNPALRRLLSFAGIGVSSVAVNGLAAGPGSPAVAFHLFALFLGGLFLVFLQVLRV